MIAISSIVAEYPAARLTRIIETPGDYLSVYVVIEKSMLISERSNLMMSIEQKLIEECDRRIRVWHEPIGDKNSLRTLRGVTLN